MPGKDLLLQDASLITTGVLATSGSATATTSTSFLDLGQGPYGQFDPQRTEFVLQTPTLTVTQLPTSVVVTYSIFASDSATTNAASANEFLTLNLATQTGAASGAVGANYYFRLPVGVNRYLFAQASCAASLAAPSAVFTLAVVF
jgi:hypothetical protein